MEKLRVSTSVKKQKLQEIPRKKLYRFKDVNKFIVVIKLQNTTRVPDHMMILSTSASEIPDPACKLDY
jgi:hypothetical protein